MIESNIQRGKYQFQESFVVDMIHIVQNAMSFYGVGTPQTRAAERLLKFCMRKLSAKQDELVRLERAMDASMYDIDSEKPLHRMLHIVVTKLKAFPPARAFLKPLNKHARAARNYEEVVKRPMDLEKITEKVIG